MLRRTLARWVARGCAASPPLERALQVACRHPAIRRVARVGAVAVAYPDVLQAARYETADVGDFRLRVNLAEHQGAGAYFFGETVVPPWLPRWVRPGDACLDVGANAGVFSLALAAATGSSGRVLAFEPNPPLLERLRASLALNPALAPRIEVVERAVADVDGAHVAFYPSLDVHNSGTSSLLAGAHGTDPAHVLDVETVTLDAVLAARGIGRVRFAKLDVEGAEALVLAGAQRLLAEHAVALWFVEARRGEPAEQRLLAAGYRGWAVQGAGLVPLEGVASGTFADYVFVAPGEQEGFRALGLS